MAAARPTIRGSDHVTPVSPASPTLANAIRNVACGPPIRKSASSASPAPAPTAVPLTAAITGFGSVASRSAIGL